MANFNLVGAYAVHGGDRAYRNTDAIDLPAGRAVIFDAANPEGLFLAPGIKRPATAATGILKQAGITLDAIKIGKTGRVRTLGATGSIADGAIATGQQLMISSVSGKEGFVKVLVGATEKSIGTALCDAADGDPVLVELNMGLPV